MPLLLLACLALAALSLLMVSAPTYDPWAWIIWGREITQWDLVTTDGPSWKPLPVLFTTPFALFGDDGAPALWLLVARAGGLLAFAMAYRLGARLAGPWAGAIAAVALVLSDEFIFNFARGNSEGMLVALVLWAVERHLDGRYSQAFLLGFAAALLRPEVWPFWGLYGLWLLVPASATWRTAALVFGCGAAGARAVVPARVPRARATGCAPPRARGTRTPTRPRSPTRRSWRCSRRSAAILSVPVYVGAVIAVVGRLAWRRDRVPLALAAMAAILMVAVALMTEAGFAGNLRYVALPAAFVCVLAGAGWVAVVTRRPPALGRRRRRGGRARAGRRVGAVRGRRRRQAPLRLGARRVRGELLRPEPEGRDRQGRRRAADQVVRPRLHGPFQVPVVAWRLHMHLDEAEIFPFGPGTALSMGSTPLSVDPRYPIYTKTRHWLAGSTCERR